MSGSDRRRALAASALLLTVSTCLASASRVAGGPEPEFRALARSSLAQLASARLPQVMLWAWERPTRLTQLPANIGVAYLAGTIVLAGDSALPRPRLQPLSVDPGTVMLAVVRVETDAKLPAALSSSQEDRAATSILAMASHPRAVGLQIDFDATPAQRPFYGALLRRLRRTMPPDRLLSITALASWCLGDPWIRGLPIDEAVPMLFEMGADSRDIRRRLEAGEDFSLPACRVSVGLSIDEPLARWPEGRRRYMFSHGGWNAAATAQAIRGR